MLLSHVLTAILKFVVYIDVKVFRSILILVNMCHVLIVIKVVIKNLIFLSCMLLMLRQWLLYHHHHLLCHS